MTSIVSMVLERPTASLLVVLVIVGVMIDDFVNLQVRQRQPRRSVAMLNISNTYQTYKEHLSNEMLQALETLIRPIGDANQKKCYKTRRGAMPVLGWK